jgi:hypothetical protein
VCVCVCVCVFVFLCAFKIVDWGFPFPFSYLFLYMAEVEWTTDMELVLFDAIDAIFPAGLRRYEAVLKLQRLLHDRCGVYVRAEDVYRRVQRAYDLDALQEFYGNYTEADLLALPAAEKALAMAVGEWTIQPIKQ